MVSYSRRRGRCVRLRRGARGRVPAAGREPLGGTSSITAAIALLHQWCGAAAPVAGVGLVGLFPSGRPERAYERVVIWAVALAGFLLREMAQGRGNVGIAAQLYLSESSVEKHVNAIFTKLGLSAEQLSHRRVTAV